ncbi:MAG: DUF2971 domain-containing protein [Mariprofundaceae bacterium]|nr:DUF2971 domain-containing protein [Mariprofundaceae bacterium]
MRINLSKKDLDRPIYRIISLERLLEIFTTNKNTLVKPSFWPDTFENFILKSKVKLLSGEIVEYNYHERMYGQCWTLHKSSDAMWQIYSPNKECLRIKTTIENLLSSIYEVHPDIPEAKCCIGKVEYLTTKDLMQVANSTFDDSGISVENIFRSLLVKRKAFEHENEVRLLYEEWSDDTSSEIYPYSINPHKLISQIMIDPRRRCSEFTTLERIIRKATGFKGPIKRSRLYSLPTSKTVTVTNILGRKEARS